MKILQKSKNGIITMCEKTFGELTSEEAKELKLACNEKIQDFKTFKVHRNKKGEIVRVVPSHFSDFKAKEIEENSKKRNIMDFYAIAFAKKQSKIYQKARKKYTTGEMKIIKKTFKNN